MTASRVLRLRDGTGRRHDSIGRASRRTSIRPLTSARRRHRSGPARTSPRCATSRSSAGVSQSTVSRVLNDVPTSVPIAEATRERVLLAARTLGYRPNPLARGLRGASTMLLGAVVRDFSDPFFAGAIEALAVESAWPRLQRRAGRTGGSTRRGRCRRSSRPATATRSCCSATCRTSRACSRTSGTRSSRWSRSGRARARSLFPTVDVDNDAGIRVGPGAPGRARPHADRDGQRPAAGRQPAAPRRVHRVHGRALRRRPPRLHPGRAEHHGRWRGGAATPCSSWTTRRRRSSPRPTSWPSASSTPRTAAGAIVPRELSVVGFDDILIAAHTVAGPDDAADADHRDGPRGRRPGRRARAGPDRAARGRAVQSFEPTLVVRESTAPPAGLSRRRPPRQPVRVRRPIAPRGQPRGVGRRRDGDPDPHGLDGPVGPREVGRSPPVSIAAPVPATPAGVASADDAEPGEVRSRRRLGRADVGVDADVLELDAGRAGRRTRRSRRAARARARRSPRTASTRGCGLR